MTAPRKPCPSCPWRVDQDASVIPNFSLDLAEALDRTCRGEFGDPIFACHQSREGEEFACAGWLAAQGANCVSARLLVVHGTEPAEALHPGDGWPELHTSFEDVIQKLRASSV